MIDGKTVIVTGGTGSFGRKFVDVALTRYSPKRVIVFSRDELKQHDMRLEVRDPRVSFFIGDVRDGERLRRAFQADVDVVVHAAAMKQVPACEYNPFEAIKTNVLGAQNVIDAAIDVGVPRVIALSTDKAVNPVNLYGASKLCAEKLFVQGNAYAGTRNTRFACVRYGNVVGSRGSVIPLFLEQKRFGQVTLTDERAGELVADARLLAAYGATFATHDAVTLAILDGLREGDATPELLAAVERAGLGGEGCADLLVVDCDSAAGEGLAACGADGVLSRAGLGEPFTRLPAFDDRSVAELRALVVRVAAAPAAAAAEVAAAAELTAGIVVVSHA